MFHSILKLSLDAILCVLTLVVAEVFIRLKNIDVSPQKSLDKAFLLIKVSI